MKKAIYVLSMGLFLSLFLLNSCEKDNEIKKPTPKDSVVTVTTPEFPKMDNSIVLDSKKTFENLAQLLTKTNPEKIALGKGRVEITDEQMEEIKVFTDKLVENAKNDIEKYQIIFKWVTTKIKYQGADNRPYTVFKERKGICQGFTNLFKIMMLTQKIPTFIANGYYVGVGGHAWNYSYFGGKWYVVDSTNKKGYRMSNFNSYKHLVPEQVEIALFSDDKFDYTYYDKQLTVVKVKKSESENLVLPVSISGFRVTGFNPIQKLPNEIKNIYLGENITSLGLEDNGLGLNFNAENIESIYVAPENKEFQSVNKIVYRKNNLNQPYYIPNKLEKIELLPIENVGKNTIYQHPNVVEIIFAKGTKKIGAYAVEDCPKLKRVYVPKETTIEEKAFFKVSDDLKIIRTE